VRRLRAAIFGLPLAEADFAHRGFHCSRPERRQRLECIGRTFLTGYNAAVTEPGIAALTARLNEVDEELRGFAFEGAAMGLAVLDHVTPWSRGRWRTLAAGAGAPHI
jgi:hypothetical protein